MIFLFSEFFQFIYQLFKRRTKIVGAVGIAVLAYLAGSASATTTTDYPVYESYYYVAQTGNFYFEKGYSHLGLILLNHGFDYAQFRLFFATLSALILYIGVRRFTENVSFFSFAYGLTVFFNDATQIRNFMMIAIIILALSFLVKLNLKNILISIVLICVSAQFQSLGYFFLLIVAIRVIPSDYFKKGLAWLMGIELLLLLISKIMGISTIISVLTKIASRITNRGNLVSKLSGQYNYGSSMTNFFGVAVSMILVLLVSYYLMTRYPKNIDYQNKMYPLYCGVIACFLALPLLFLAIDYSRIQRNGFLFFLIIVAIFLENTDFSGVNWHKNSGIFIVIVVVCVLVAVVNYHIWGPLYQQSIPYLAKILKS